MFKKKMMCLGIFVAILSLCGFTSAGDLEPTDPPGPTMKTLDEIPPTWSQKIIGIDRFKLVLDGTAVLDRETGIVWEREPSGTLRNWQDAILHCIKLDKGGRAGWALATVQGLSSLLDFTDPDPPFYLVTPHPFEMPETDTSYWSSTVRALNLISSFFNDTKVAWKVDFMSGHINPKNTATDAYLTWCVRGENIQAFGD